MRLEREKSLEAVLVLCTGLLVMFYFFDKPALLIAATVVGVPAVLSSWVAQKVAWFWYRLAEVLGRINGFIILSLIFFLILTPVAWLAKLFRKAPSSFDDKNESTSSYFIKRDHSFQKEDLENPW